MNPIFKELASVPPLELHYAIGANCYQHARGYDKAIVATPSPPTTYQGDVQVLVYASLYPGNAASVFLKKQSPDRNRCQKSHSGGLQRG